MVHRSACAGFQAEAGCGQHDEQDARRSSLPDQQGEQGACRSPLPDQYDGQPEVYLKKALQADKMMIWLWVTGSGAREAED